MLFHPVLLPLPSSCRHSQPCNRIVISRILLQTAFRGYKNVQLPVFQAFSKLVLILWFIFLYSQKNGYNMIRYMILQFVWEPVLFHRILIGFEAILEKFVESFWATNSSYKWQQKCLEVSVLKSNLIESILCPCIKITGCLSL